MLNFILHLIGDLIVFKLMWRGYKMTRQGYNQFLEVKSDHQARVRVGWAIIIFCIGAIILNHVFF